MLVGFESLSTQQSSSSNMCLNTPSGMLQPPESSMFRVKSNPGQTATKQLLVFRNCFSLTGNLTWSRILGSVCVRTREWWWVAANWAFHLVGGGPFLHQWMIHPHPTFSILIFGHYQIERKKNKAKFIKYATMYFSSFPNKTTPQKTQKQNSNSQILQHQALLPHQQN